MSAAAIAPMDAESTRVRTLSGISMDLGITLLVYNLARTVLEPAPRLVRGEPTSIEPLRPGEAAP